MKRFSLMAFAILPALLLCGCWDKREIEDNTFVVLLGIDRADESDIVVTIAFPQTQKKAGAQGGDSGGEYTTMSARAPSVVEAVSMFSSKLSGPLALYSVKTIVLSREIAQSTMLRHVFSSWRYREIRNTTGVLISECSASEFIKARLEDSPIAPLRQEELLLERINNSAYYKPVQLLELLSSLRSNSGDAVVMYGGVSNSEEEGEETKKAATSGYLPGEMPIEADNKSQISGLAVFKGSRMVGVLDSAQAQAYSMLTGSSAGEVITLPDPLDRGSNIVIAIMSAKGRKINAAIEEGNAKFSISLNLKCSIESIQSGIDYTLPDNYNILTEHIKSMCTESMLELIKKTQKEYNADILKLGDKLSCKFATQRDWESYNWPLKYNQAEIELDVRLEIEHTGTMLP